MRNQNETPKLGGEGPMWVGGGSERSRGSRTMCPPRINNLLLDDACGLQRSKHIVLA